MLENQTILVTGGTGSFGHITVRELLKHDVAEIRIFSRDEEKQLDMHREIQDEKLKFLIGNVRDYERICEATEDVDIIYHVAALKIIPVCEKFPMESLKTNILGTSNVKKAAIENKVEKSIFIGTDKAVQPVNIYGACKMFAEKLWVQSQGDYSKFSSMRYGNVVGSRGSVVPFFKQLIQKRKPLPITHPDMTRFLITLQQAISLVFYATEHMKGGEIYTPILPSCKIVDLAKVMGGDDYPLKTVGIRPGEKIHEVLVSEEEFRRTEKKNGYYIIHPYGTYNSGKVREEFTSENAERLDSEGIKKLLDRSGWLCAC